MEPSPSQSAAAPPHLARRIVSHVVAFFGYLALSAFYLRPILRVLGTRIAPDLGDPVFVLIVLKWGMHQIRLGLPSFWNLPYFFPAQGVTTYSDHLLGPAALGALLTGVVPNPLALYNLYLLTSFALTGWTTWYVLRRRGLGVAAAFLGGCMFAFCPFRWDQLSHLQLLLMQWIPLTLFSWDRLLERPTWRRAALFLTFYVLHVTGGSYLAYMIHVPMLALLLVRARALWSEADRRRTAVILIPAGLVAAVVLAAVFLPYLRVAHSQERTLQETRAFGASLASYATASHHNLYGALSAPWWRAENALFPGFTITALALVVGARALPRRRNRALRPLRPWQKALLGVLLFAALAGFVRGEIQTWTTTGRIGEYVSVSAGAFRASGRLLALGIVALVLRRRLGGNWPLTFQGLGPWECGLLLSAAASFLLTFDAVYLSLVGVIPGLSGMRVPARFGIFVTFALAVFAAREIDRWVRRARSSRARVIALALLACLLFVETAPRPLRWFPLPREADFPPVFAWLGHQDDVRAVLVLPLGGIFEELSTMYFATASWKPLVNGYSGHLPRDYVDFRKTCCSPAPAPAALDRLRTWGVTHILFRPAALEGIGDRARFEEWRSQPGIELVYDDGADLVCRILPLGRT